MSREALTNNLRVFFARIPGLGWVLMDKSAGFFEDHMVPGKNTMPDSPRLGSHRHDDTVGLWSQVISVQGQAESGTTHHDYADAIVVTLLATAAGLENKNPNHSKVISFTRKTGMTPKEFLDKYGQ